MNTTNIKSSLWVCVIGFSLVLSACGNNNPTSSNEEDPPEFPTFSQVQPDLTYFENNSAQKSLDNENFNTGRSYALSLASASMIADAYASFFSSVDLDDADFEDGTWIWEYSYTYYQGESVSVELTAEESGNDIIWQMNWSYNGNEGPNFENYTMIEGRVSQDGNSGSWTFNELGDDMSTETPVLVSNWSQEGESEATITTDIYDEGSVEMTFQYTQSGVDHTLSLESSDISNNILIYWNTDSNTGYYQTGGNDGERHCWDSDFQNVAC